jgi:phage tail sheath protein FI
MPSYLHPGVYLEEIASGSRPIEGVATSITAFVGFVLRNSNAEPTLIGNMDDYLQKFGPIVSPEDAMGHAVQAFYLNGGGTAYICPVIDGAAANATVEIKDSGGTNKAFDITTLGKGPWGNKLYVRIKNPVDKKDFTLEIGTQNTDNIFFALEKHNNVSVLPGSDNHIENIVNSTSSLVQISNVLNVKPSTAQEGTPLTGGTPTTLPQAQQFTTFYNTVLRKIRDVSIVVNPGTSWESTTDKSILSTTLAHCESMKNRVLILDPPTGSPTKELKNSSDVTGLVLPTSTYSVLYYPWVSMVNPLYHPDKNPGADLTINVAPSAIAAGLWAKTDAKRGVWKAPAGVATQITGVSALEFIVEDFEQDQLNPLGVNSIRKIPNFGSVIWGSRTLATKADPEWRYVPVRRTAIFIEESIYNGIQWAVFEPNTHLLWSSLRANIGSFMNGLFRSGAFQGEKANDAYFVRCGLGDTMTQGDIDRGQVIVIVGFAPVKPAEFVIVRIQQMVGQQ